MGVFLGMKQKLMYAWIGAVMHAGKSGHASFAHTVTLHGLPGCYLYLGPIFHGKRKEKGLADKYLLTLLMLGGEGGTNVPNLKNLCKSTT